MTASTDLYTIAKNFRFAIEKAVAAGEIEEMRTFPSGCCSYASDLLQRYLIEKYDYFTWYVSGEYEYGKNGESHAWLESIDCLVIDITSDQYKFKKPQFDKPVYVGPRNDGSHNKFSIYEPVAYSREEDPFGMKLYSDRRYESVLRYI